MEQVNLETACRSFLRDLEACEPTPEQSDLARTLRDAVLEVTATETVFRVVLPFNVESEANRRGHWTEHSGREARQRESTALVCMGALGRRRKPDLPLVVIFTREYGEKYRPFDDDNLPRAFKTARDGVADWLFGHRKSDSREGLVWRYRQVKGGRTENRCTVEVRRVP